MTAFIGNSNILLLSEAQNEADNSYFNAAAVTVVVTDANGAVVIASVAMDYVAASNGNYRYVIPTATALVANQQYKAAITAVQTGITGRWDFLFKPRTRRDE